MLGAAKPEISDRIFSFGRKRPAKVMLGRSMAMCNKWAAAIALSQSHAATQQRIARAGCNALVHLPQQRQARRRREINFGKTGAETFSIWHYVQSSRRRRNQAGTSKTDRNGDFKTLLERLN